MIHTLGETISDDDSDLNYDTSLINVGLSGKFRSDKEKYTLLFDLSPDMFEDFSHRFLLDAHIETTRIKNHTILFGSSRRKSSILFANLRYSILLVLLQK
jgi:hypothetical protein